MGIYVYIGHDGLEGATLRPRVRPQHLEHISEIDAADRCLFAGPLLDEDGVAWGSLVILEAEDLASARAFAKRDPYLTEGVFQRLEVHPSAAVFPKAKSKERGAKR